MESSQKGPLEAYIEDLLQFNIGTLSHHELKMLGFTNEHLPPWQQEKLIDSSNWCVDTLNLMKSGYMLGLNHQKVARFARISPRTLLRWRQKSQELCQLIRQREDFTEIKARCALHALINEGHPDVVMAVIKKSDPRYQSGYQKRCPDCQNRIMTEYERKRKGEESLLAYGLMKTQKELDEQKDLKDEKGLE